MLIGIIGNMGAGKTLLLTFLTWIYKHKKNAFVATNYRNHVADLTLSAEELLVQISDLNKKEINLLAIDEIGKIAQATNWYTDINDIIGKIFTESRKRNFDIAYTSQSALMVDRNIRRVTDITLLPQYDTKTKEVTVAYFEYKGIYWLRDEDFNFNGEQFFNLYDTNEVILPNKESIVNYYMNELLKNETLYQRVLEVSKKSEQLDLITFYMGIKSKLAKMILDKIR